MKTYNAKKLLMKLYIKHLFALSAFVLLSFSCSLSFYDIASASQSHPDVFSTALNDAPQGTSPHGESRGGYGAKRKISTKEDAEKLLQEYFAGKKVNTGEIKEKDLYFEAEIRNQAGELIDTVVIDKRTGRIRSIY